MYCRFIFITSSRIEKIFLLKFFFRNFFVNSDDLNKSLGRLTTNQKMWSIFLLTFDNCNAGLRKTFTHTDTHRNKDRHTRIHIETMTDTHRNKDRHTCIHIETMTNTHPYT